MAAKGRQEQQFQHVGSSKSRCTNPSAPLNLDFRKLNCFWLKRLHLVAMFDGPSAFADIADHPAQEFTTFEMSNNPRTQFIGAVKAITMILTIQIVLKSGDA